jgi:hypothetical protein
MSPMRQKRQIRDGVRDILVQLGGDVDTITTKLWAAGVRGIPNSAEDCVVARYLHAVISGDRAILNVRVWRSYVRINFVSLRTRSILIQLPLPIQMFIAAFDRRDVPDLIDQTRTEVQEAAEIAACMFEGVSEPEPITTPGPEVHRDRD